MTFTNVSCNNNLDSNNNNYFNNCSNDQISDKIQKNILGYIEKNPSFIEQPAGKDFKELIANGRINLDPNNRIYKLLGIGEQNSPFLKSINFEKNVPKQHLANPDHIPFNQQDVIQQVNDGDFPTLEGILDKYNGLCDLICNQMLFEDGLENNSLKSKFNVKKLNREELKNSHILKIYSIFERFIAYFFSIYADNIFSIREQWNLVANDKINKEILRQKLTQTDNGQTFKLEVITKKRLKLEGHSLLVKKVDTDSFIFFDPNTGIHKNLTFEELVDHINEQLLLWEATDLLFIKKENFLKRLPSQSKST